MKRFRSRDQYFLNSEKILDLEARLAGVTGKSVLEIGVGDGRLTYRIIRYAPKELYLIERDERFAKLLLEKFPQANIIQGDATKLDWPKTEIIIGNIPYSISSKIIFKMAEFEKAVFIVQEEFARKMVAKANSSNYGRLSVTSQLRFNIKIVKKIPAKLFSPKPKVDSALIILTPKNKLTEFEEELIRKIFQTKNQNLAKVLRRVGYECPEEYANKRARELSPEEIKKLMKSIKSDIF